MLEVCPGYHSSHKLHHIRVLLVDVHRTYLHYVEGKKSNRDFELARASYRQMLPFEASASFFSRVYTGPDIDLIACLISHWGHLGTNREEPWRHIHLASLSLSHTHIPTHIHTHTDSQTHLKTIVKCTYYIRDFLLSRLHCPLFFLNFLRTLWSLWSPIDVQNVLCNQLL